MSAYTISSIATIIGGSLTMEHNSTIRHLVLDSRKTTSAEALFFAIRGEQHDGHSFIADAYAKGVRNFVVSQPIDASAYPNSNFITVNNALHALQQLCAHHRQQFNIPVIGITGSNGKTVVKEWLFQLLEDEHSIARSPKSYNSQVGVPLSLWQLAPYHTLGIFEAGISQVGEMQRLAPMVQPTIGVFTNIGVAHAENFDNAQQKAQEKAMLFQQCEHVIYCSDDPVVAAAVQQLTHPRRYNWSRQHKATLSIVAINTTAHATHITGLYKTQAISITIPFTDSASIENAIHCWLVLLTLEVTNNTIAQRMTDLTPVAMRLELLNGINECTVVNDSYNSDLGSLEIALDLINQQKQHSKKTLILSDILQSGWTPEQLYKEVARMVRDKGIARLIGIGPTVSKHAHLFEIEGSYYPSTEAFLAAYNPSLFQQETILLKGARKFRFEQISNLLQQKNHETVLEINLNAVVHNLNYYKNLLQPNTKLMVMVKAFAYGSGGFEIANVLEFNRVDYLAVAYADEGIELRKKGIRLPIMVMSPEPATFEDIIRYQLEPELYSLSILQQFAQAVSINNTAYPVHLKLDTGMHRLGFAMQEMDDLIAALKQQPQLQVQSVFSHLAASDEAPHDNFTHQQAQQFEAMANRIAKHYEPPILRHLLNSAGISRFPEYQFDMVRLGIGLYGIGVAGNQEQLQNISTLKTVISQIKTVDDNASIGYGRSKFTQGAMRIATLPIGYADGLRRQLSNGNGHVWIHGKKAPIVGRVCMDMCMVNLDGIDAQEGDEVVIFGDEHPIAEWAEQMNTIPYEVLTGISRRVKRIYYQE